MSSSTQKRVVKYNTGPVAKPAPRPPLKARPTPTPRPKGEYLDQENIPISSHNTHKEPDLGKDMSWIRSVNHQEKDREPVFRRQNWIVDKMVENKRKAREARMRKRKKGKKKGAKKAPLQPIESGGPIGRSVFGMRASGHPPEGENDGMNVEVDRDGDGEREQGEGTFHSEESEDETWEIYKEDEEEEEKEVLAQEPEEREKAAAPPHPHPLIDMNAEVIARQMLTPAKQPQNKGPLPVKHSHVPLDTSVASDDSDLSPDLDETMHVSASFAQDSGEVSDLSEKLETSGDVDHSFEAVASHKMEKEVKEVISGDSSPEKNNHADTGDQGEGNVKLESSQIVPDYYTQPAHLNDQSVANSAANNSLPCRDSSSLNESSHAQQEEENQEEEESEEDGQEEEDEEVSVVVNVKNDGRRFTKAALLSTEAEQAEDGWELLHEG
eukprot:g3775.t1